LIRQAARYALELGQRREGARRLGDHLGHFVRGEHIEAAPQERHLLGIAHQLGEALSRPHLDLHQESSLLRMALGGLLGLGLEGEPPDPILRRVPC